MPNCRGSATEATAKFRDRKDFWSALLGKNRKFLNIEVTPTPHQPQFATALIRLFHIDDHSRSVEMYNHCVAYKRFLQR